jgi:hypothetical protein
MTTAAFNELDQSWNRVIRTMYVVKARMDEHAESWVLSCADHDGTVVAEACGAGSMSIEEALDAAEELCPPAAW